jgi:hypothetical protein
MTLNLKAVGKRPVAMIGSGGSSPPCASAFMVPGGMPCIIAVFFSFFLLTLRPGFLTPACML